MKSVVGEILQKLLNPRRRSVWLAFALLGPTAAFCDDQIQSPALHSRDYSGLYVRIDPEYRPQYDAFSRAIAQDFVDGVAIMIQWAKLEPAPGLYDFADLDKWVLLSVFEHKKISLGVFAGESTPPWLYVPPYNVDKNEFRYNRNPQGAPLCANLILPSPWNRQFIVEYNKMIVEMARHLKDMSLPGLAEGAAYEAVRIVKLDGINNTTEELRLVANKGDGGPCQQSDAREIWSKAGFTPDKIAAAWSDLIDNTGKVFSDKLLSMDIIQSGSFPAVDNAGKVYIPKPKSLDALTARLVDLAVSKFRARISVQWNALTQFEPNPQVELAGGQGAVVAWQMNEFLGPRGGAGCFYGQQRLPCRSDADFSAILENGIARGARFIEIWAANVAQFGAAFRQAHEELKRRSQ